MAEMSVIFRSIPETGAAIGLTGTHSVVVDRPIGKAGGRGLGFNGGELLALAVGGCFCNDLHYVAAKRGIEIASLAVEVTVKFEGEPLLATAITVDAKVISRDSAADIAGLIAEAQASSTVSNSITRGVPVAFV